MTGRPKISVLIPTYRYARFLPEAIESVLRQDFRDFEVVVADDASGDGSPEIARDHARRDPRVRVQVHERNLGMVANWNWCLEQARGDYVKFLFGDDRLMSDSALGRMAGLLDAEPRAVLAASARMLLDAESRPTGVWNGWGSPGFHPGPAVIGRCMWEDANLVGEPSAVLFRREAAARGFDPVWRQVVDQEMWFHLLTQGGMVYEPEPLCAFRQHDAQQTVANRHNKIGSTESLVLTRRYLDYYLAYVGLHTGCMLEKRFLFRRIYYARKERCRSPERVEAETALLERLTPRWYFGCWLAHRLTKPFINLRRFFQRRVHSRA